MFEFNNVHYAIPIPYVIGQTVYGMNSHLSSSLALHPVHKYIAKGLIVSLQPQTHTVFVYFDDVDDSIHQLSVTDLAVLFSSFFSSLDGWFAGLYELASLHKSTSF